MRPLNVGSLFSGIGGFDLGLERAGMQTAWQVEQDPYCLAVLAKHFPDAERFTDVREVGAHNLAPVDVVCGGFPCQDLSVAGRGAGIDGERSGLWAEFARIIGEIGPRYAVVENVPALRSRGLDRVLRDLAALGYDAEWDCIPASAIGAPHQRDRFWLVAYPNIDGEELRAGRSLRDGWEVRAALGGVTAAAHAADAQGDGRGSRRPGRSARAGANGEGESPQGMADAGALGRERREGQQGARRQEAERGEASGDAGNGGVSCGAAADADRERPQGSRSTRSTTGRERQSGDQGQAGELADAEGQPERAGLRSSGAGGERGRRPGDGGGEGGGAISHPDQRDGQPSPVAGPGVRREARGERPDDHASGAGSDETGWWATEPDVGRVADGVPSRVDRLSALGNALVPQIAEWIGRRIMEYEANG